MNYRTIIELNVTYKIQSQKLYIRYIHNVD